MRRWLIRSKECVCVSLSVVSDLFVTPWTAACQAPPSMEFSRQEYCSGLPFPSPRSKERRNIKSYTERLLLQGRVLSPATS